MTAKALFLLLCLAGGIAPAAALDMDIRPNAAEMNSLPPFCAARFKVAQGSPEWKTWESRIGQNFLDVHHYCFALVAVHRYWGARTKQERGFYLQRALNNYDYIVNAAKPDFALRAELYSDRGELFKLMRKPGDAIKDFNQAIAINPRLAKPYLQLADLHVAGKAPARALETVTEGLRQLPDSTALQRRYLELGGKKPFPEPVVAEVAEPASPPPADAAPVADKAAEPAPGAAAAEGTGAAPAADAAPAIGTPRNPYCRFCPPE